MLLDPLSKREVRQAPGADAWHGFPGIQVRLNNFETNLTAALVSP
jgi:hypothetical protein